MMTAHNIRSWQGHQPELASSAYIDPQATVIGQVRIGEHSSVWPQVAIRGDVQRIEIGAYTNIQDGAVLHVTSDNRFTPGGFPLIIGDRVTIGHGAILHACTIEDECLIGMGATVLDGAVVEAGAMVAAGSLVPPGKRLCGGSLWLGNPVKEARQLRAQERDYLSFSADHYRELKDQYLHDS